MARDKVGLMGAAPIGFDEAVARLPGVEALLAPILALDTSRNVQ